MSSDFGKKPKNKVGLDFWRENRKRNHHVHSHDLEITTLLEKSKINKTNKQTKKNKLIG